MQPEDSGPRFRMHLNEKPFFPEYPNILQAQVASKPESSFQWYHGDELIEPSKDVRIHTEGNKSVLMLKHGEEG